MDLGKRSDDVDLKKGRSNRRLSGSGQRDAMRRGDSSALGPGLAGVGNDNQPAVTSCCSADDDVSGEF